MYKCQICGITSKPRTPAHKVVIETRSTTYKHRTRANACWKWIKGKRKFVHPDDPGGRGREYVREITVCASCAQTLRQPAVLKVKAANH